MRASAISAAGLTSEQPTLSPALFAHQRTVSAPRMSPDGRSLAFAVEYDGRTDLFVTSDGGWPVQITAEHALSGGNYAWAPDGRSFVFTAATDGKLWLLPATGGAGRRLSLREGRHHTPRFSPDGRFVSFLCDRGDEIDVVALSVDGSWQRVLNWGSDFPLDPSWSPDGTRLLWHAYPYNVMPWDQSALLVADLDGGAPRTIVAGSRVAYANARFSPDGTRIVCVCDQGGALNVTEMAADGSGQTTLHADEWEHGEPVYAQDGRTIVYTRNVDGDYTLWTVAAGESPRPLTDAPGRASSPSWAPNGGSVVFTLESPLAPPDVYEIEVASRRITRRTFTTLAGNAAANLTLPEHVSWTSADGFQVHGLLYTPPDARPRRQPCLVEIHGGPMNQSRAVWNPLLQFFVERGWVVIQPNYRGTLGYGRAYREALFGSWGKGDLEDYLGGVELCVERGLIRTDQVVAWGGSAGGYSTLLCLTGAPDRFAAGVALFGLYDLYTFLHETHRYERYYVDTILGPAIDHYPLWHERSPLNHVARMRAPVLLLQGEKDPAVAPAQSETLIRELERHRIDYEYAYYPGEGHGFRKVATNIDYALRMDRFLTQKVLRAPWTSPLGTLPYPPMALPPSVAATAKESR